MYNVIGPPTPNPNPNSKMVFYTIKLNFENKLINNIPNTECFIFGLDRITQKKPDLGHMEIQLNLDLA